MSDRTTKQNQVTEAQNAGQGVRTQQENNGRKIEVGHVSSEKDLRYMESCCGSPGLPAVAYIQCQDSSQRVYARFKMQQGGAQW